MGRLQERDSKVTDNNNEVYSCSGPSFAGRVGLSYFINRSVSFDLGLQYSYNRLKNKLNEIQTYNVNAFAVTLGSNDIFLALYKLANKETEFLPEYL